MTNLELLLIAVALSMDAFSVSICKGLTFNKIELKKILIISISFGLFQGIMPLIGYGIGYTFANFINMIDHWIAFILLNIIGFNMLRDGLNNDNVLNNNFKIKEILLLAVATSMDALTVGVTFAFLKINILYSISLISLITFIICFCGVFLGIFFGNKHSNKAVIFGGLILMLLGFKILFDHLH